MIGTVDPLGRGKNNEMGYGLIPTEQKYPGLPGKLSWLPKGIGSFNSMLQSVVEGLRSYAGRSIPGARGMTRAQGGALADAGRLMVTARGNDQNFLSNMQGKSGISPSALPALTSTFDDEEGYL